MKPPSLPRKKAALTFTTTEAAEHVKADYGFTVTRQTINNWIKRGRYGARLPATETIHGFQVKKEDLDAYVKTHVL